MGEKEKQLRVVKNEVVQVGFERSAKEAGKGILEGVSKLMGNSKVKKLEAEIEGLNSDIVNLEAEKENTERKAKTIISQKEREIEEKDKLINVQQSKLDKIFESIPILKNYDFIMHLCETIRIPFDIVKQIFSGKKASFSGELYSPEHKQSFKTDNAILSIGKSKENKSLLAINDMHYAQWFRQQKNKLLENLGVKVNESQKRRGINNI